MTAKHLNLTYKFVKKYKITKSQGKIIVSKTKNTQEEQIHTPKLNKNELQ